MAVSRRELHLCAAVLVSFLIAGSAAAFDSIDSRAIENDRTEEQHVWDGNRLPALAMTEIDGRGDEVGRVGRVLDRLKRLPIRPVKIGDTPRRPDDPEPGAGVVLKIRF